MPKPKESHELQLRIRSAADPRALDAVHDAMQRDGQALDAAVARELLQAYTAARDWAGVKRVWTELQGSGIVPSGPLYNAAIEAYSTAQEVDKLKAVLSEMEAAGLPMDAAMHVPVLRAALHSGDTELVPSAPLAFTSRRLPAPAPCTTSRPLRNFQSPGLPPVVLLGSSCVPTCRFFFRVSYCFFVNGTQHFSQRLCLYAG